MPNFFTSLVGSKPVVPDLPQLQLSAEQQKALTANLQALPRAQQIATQVDLFNQQQIDQMLENVIPNYKAITGQVSQNIAALTAGQIPTDVSQQIQRSTAAQSLAGGFAGTQAGGGLLARDLGLTSLDLTQRGLASAESWMKTASSIYQPGMFNVTSMFVTPQQMASFDVEERNAQFQRQWMQNQIAAMPAPWAEDLKQFVYRAMAAYSGTPVQSNPYSTPGSFGEPGLASPNFGPSDIGSSPYSLGAGEGGATFDVGLDVSGGGAFQGPMLDAGAGFGGAGGGGGLAGVLG
jgi:hypothetical protein